MTIGIFDTGLGGEIVAKRLHTYFPSAEFIVINDRAHLPYGNRSADEIYELTKRATSGLIGNCDILVIACNTATAAAIERLRSKFPLQQFVGYEPMIKPAATQSKNQRVVVLATAATVSSERYQNLISQFARDTIVRTPDTTNWAAQIEAGSENSIDLSEVSQEVSDGADIIVLACTHYLAIEDTLRAQFPSATVIEPTGAVAKRIATLASQPRQ